jgi:hypothetical protein
VGTILGKEKRSIYLHIKLFGIEIVHYLGSGVEFSQSWERGQPEIDTKSYR